jgi:hypothetical protein
MGGKRSSETLHVSEGDLVNTIETLMEKEGIDARWIIDRSPLTRALRVESQTYRTVNGVRLGLAKDVRLWTPGGRLLLPVMLISLHHSYADFKDMAYAALMEPRKRS